MGHPQLGVAFREGVVTLSEGWDGPGAAPHALRTLSLDVASLETAVKDAREELDGLSTVLANTVAPMAPPGVSPAALAHVLVNGGPGRLPSPRPSPPGERVIR